MKDLTRQERKLLRVIVTFWERNGRGPCLKEMTAGMGYGYHGATLRLLNRLERRRYVLRVHGYVTYDVIRDVE